MERRLEIARTQGIVSLEEIGTACCFAVQDKFWVDDPDGNQWEVYYFHEDVEFNDPKYQEEDASACCMPLEREDSATVEQTTVVAEKPKVKLSELTANNNSNSCCDPSSGCC